MKCLKKFLALGMCAGVMSTSSCSAILPDEVMRFYLSTGIDEVVLKSPKGLRAICCFLDGGNVFDDELENHDDELENHLLQVYEQAKASNDGLDSLRGRLATYLESIREDVEIQELYYLDPEDPLNVALIDVF